MNEFAYKTKIIDDKIDGIGGWVWPVTDSGLWDGPKNDWPALKQGLQTNVSKFDVCVQAGGACGMYPRLLSQLFSVVYTFEPDPLNFHCLTNNCQSPNIIKINTALGGRNELVSIQHGHESNLGTHRITGNGTRIIPTFAIDQLELEQCDLIQLDVEGYEENVLSGAMNTISRFKPVVVIETCSEKSRQWLTSLGYTFIGRFGHADSLFAVL